MAEVLVHQQQTAAAPTYRCTECRDTGVLMSTCPRECGSHPVACFCQDKKLVGEQEWRAIRLELMAGLPIAAVAGLLLYLFH